MHQMLEDATSVRGVKLLSTRRTIYYKMWKRGPSDIWSDPLTVRFVQNVLQWCQLSLEVALQRQFFSGCYELDWDTFQSKQVIEPALTLVKMQERWNNTEDWCRKCLNLRTQHDWKCCESPWNNL